MSEVLLGEIYVINENLDYLVGFTSSWGRDVLVENVTSTTVFYAYVNKLDAGGHYKSIDTFISNTRLKKEVDFEKDLKDLINE